MDSIDWPGLARNALWVLGLAVAFAAASHASWRATVRGERLRQELLDPAFLTPGSAGLLLVTASLAWGAALVWERWLWAALSLGLIWQIFELLRQPRTK